jgi:hypothetical protein
MPVESSRDASGATGVPARTMLRFAYERGGSDRSGSRNA